MTGASCVEGVVSSQRGGTYSSGGFDSRSETQGFAMITLEKQAWSAWGAGKLTCCSLRMALQQLQPIPTPTIAATHTGKADCLTAISDAAQWENIHPLGCSLRAMSRLLVLGADRESPLRLLSEE